MRAAFKSLALLAGWLLTTALAEAPTSDALDQPWSNPANVLVLDPYSGNEIDWDALASDPRVVGIIHRAADGLRADTAYQARYQEANRRGYLWGAFLLGRSGDPIAQADLLVQVTATTPGALLALDLESFDDRHMSIADAIRFLDRVRERTGVTPVIYANKDVTIALSGDPDFVAHYGDAALWYARFKRRFNARDLGHWRRYFLWQFSSEINCSHDGECLYNPPGVHFDMDVDVFNGTRDQLAEQWAGYAAPPPILAPPSH